jgi:hypothetical protein
MNETTCEQCNEGEAIALIEKSYYSEAICESCQRLEREAIECESHKWDMKVMREENENERE